jgi:hypothetical protein
MDEREPTTNLETSTGTVRREHPELYGKLLEANAAISDAGGGLIFFVYLVLLLTAYCGLWMGWYRQVPVLRRMELGNIWVYALVFTVVTGLWICHFNWLQRLCYGRHREEILELLRPTKMSRYVFLAEIEGDQSLSEVAAAMKRDRWESF